MTIVRETRLVSGTNVTIPAPELAVSTPNATFSITSRLAIVLKDTLEIRSLAVVKRNVSVVTPPLLCSIDVLIVAPKPQNPCNPSPCGPNSQCREINGQAVCSCLTGYVGSPPTCRPECVSSSDCALNRACINQKCVDPCPGTCGINGLCQVVNHNPICTCPPRYTGDPFTQCKIIIGAFVYS
jgi:hypothetical protein